MYYLEPCWILCVDRACCEALGNFNTHLDLESISWTSWGREEEVSSTVQDMVLDGQGNGWAQGGVGPEVR